MAVKTAYSLLCAILCMIFSGFYTFGHTSSVRNDTLWSAIDSAEILKLKGRYEDAITILENCKIEANKRRDQKVLAKCNIELADVLRFTYYFTQESATVDEAFRLLEEADNIIRENPKEATDILPRYYIYLGKLIRDNGYSYGKQFADTVKVFLENAKVSLETGGASENEWARYHYESGVYNANIGAEKEAEYHFNRLLEIVVHHFHNLDYFRGLYLYEAGVFFFDSADLEKSLLCAQLAQYIFNHSSNRDITRTLNAEILIANGYYSTDATSSDGYLDALYHYRKALEIIHDTDNQNPTNETIILTNMGLAFYRLQMFDSSMQTVKKAMALNPARRTFEKSIQAMSLLNLGLLHNQSGEEQDALKYFEKAIETVVSNIGPKHYRTHLIYRLIGESFAKKGNYNLALGYLQKGLIALFDEFDEQDIYTNPTWTDIESVEPVLYILFEKAGVLFSRYQKDGHLNDLLAALELYNQGYVLMNIFLNQEIMSESIIIFFSNFRKSFQTSVDCAFQAYEVLPSEQHFQYALKFMEQSKYFLLLKSQQNAKLREEFEGNAQHFLSERALNSEIEYLKHNLEKIEKTQEEEIFKTRNIILEKTVQKSTLREKINKNFVSIPVIENSVPLTIGEIREELIHDAETIVEYYWSDNFIYTAVISKGGYEALVIPVTPELMNQITIYSGILSGNDSKERSGNSQFNQYLRSSHFLYQTLFEPVISATQKTGHNPDRTFTIIADGPLSFLPFEAFTTSLADTTVVSYWGLPYLCRDFVFNYMYSLNIKKQHRYNDVHGRNSGVLAMSYSSDMVNNTDLEKLRSENELPFSGREVEVVSGIFKYSRPRIVQNATEDQFKIFAPQHAIIHLAIHGQADTQDKYNSKLLFRQLPSSKEDGQLHAYELYDLDLSKTQLAVLSACETGLGKQLDGEGIFSIARGFVYAGCRSIVMSLWKVNDKSTSILMQYFYENLASGMTKDTALRKAKLDYISESDDFSAHPANWAAFISLGNVAPVSLDQGISMTRIVFAGLIVIIFGLGFYRLRSKS